MRALVERDVAKIARLAGHHGDDAFDRLAARTRAAATPSSKSRPWPPAGLRQQHAADAGLAPANGAPPELGVEGDHRGRPRIHQAPEPGRGVVRCSSSSSVRDPAQARPFGESFDDPADGVHDDRGLAQLREVARTGRVELPAVRGEGDQGLLVRRSQVGHLFGHLAAGRWSGRGHDGERHIGEWRGVLDLATRAIDPAGLVERAIPAQRIADLEDGVQGADPAGLERRPSPCRRGAPPRPSPRHTRPPAVAGRTVARTARRGSDRAGGTAGEPRSRSAGRAGCRRSARRSAARSGGSFGRCPAGCTPRPFRSAGAARTRGSTRQAARRRR